MSPIIILKQQEGTSVNVNKNICYVIMPYGGDDPVKQGHYTAVYQLLIKTPAEQCGFEVKIEKA